MLGTGMRLDPRDVEVLDVAEGHGSVRLGERLLSAMLRWVVASSVSMSKTTNPW